MAKPIRYSKWALAAIGGGVALTAIEVYGAISYLVSQGTSYYLVIGGAVVTMVAASLPVFAGRCWQRGQYLFAVFLWTAMVPALSVVFTAAVTVTGGARDDAGKHRQAIAQQIGLKRAAVDEAKAVADTDELAAKAECASGRGTKCTGLEARADKSRIRLETARTELAQAGVVPTDPQARRLAAILPVSEEAIQLYQPLILPITISILGVLMIAVGAHPHRPKVIPRRGKRKKRRRRSARKASGNVVPLRPRRFA